MPPASTAAVNPSGEAMVHNILATSAADHIPLEAVSLPNLLQRSTVSNGVVTPLTTAAPAPMGIGTYGVLNTTGTPSAYTIETQSWEGSITINSVNTFLLANDGALSTNGSQNTFGVQLNAVTNDSTVGSHSVYSFWTQNVLYFNFPYPGTITFLDNVWNFSSPAVALTAGTIYSGNGTPVYPEYYYDFGPTFSVTYPLTVQLYLNSSVTNLPSTGYGYTTVRFGYNVIDASTGMSEGSGVYDTVLFNSTTPIGSVPASPYLVDGSQVTPTGFIPWDAEIMIGGPGGGTTTSVYGISGSESLQYWDSTSGKYAIPADAWNLGSETGETSEGIAETYTSPGTVWLSTGPSIPMPFWGATPGGNIGQATFSGPLSPSNAFVFFTPGAGFDANYAAWAPTQTASTVDYMLPPGTYTVTAMMSDYTPIQTTVTGTSGGSAALPFTMQRNFAEGVYTPLFAWSNAQLAAISFGGMGTASLPYIIVNNPAPGGLNPVFGQFNDYLYQVFPGVLIAGTTAYVSLNEPSLLNVTYPTGYWATLYHFALPFTNNLQFQIFDASHVSIWDAQGISGWFFFEDYGPTGFLPLANVVIWGGYHDLVGDNTFVSQGSSLLLAGANPLAPTDNVVWGNTFVNSTMLSPAMYPGTGSSNGPPIAIWAYESGDWIYNNWVGTSITAYAPNANMFFGSPQINAENWNLSIIEPSYFINAFNGHWLTGSIVGSAWQGGNFWADYVPGSALPYDEFGFIATGGDYLPYPLVAYAIVFAAYGPAFGEAWSVTVNGVTQMTTGYFLVFFETPGTYAFTATVLPGGGSVQPSSGTVSLVSHDLYVVLTLH
jgi:thermopsin